FDPLKNCFSPEGTGVRKRAHRRSTSEMSLPRRTWSNRLRTVSTSGNSGIVAGWRGHGVPNADGGTLAPTEFVRLVKLGKRVGRGRQQRQPVNWRNQRVRKQKRGDRPQPQGLPAHPRETCLPTRESPKRARTCGMLGIRAGTGKMLPSTKGGRSG